MYILRCCNNNTVSTVLDTPIIGRWWCYITHDYNYTEVYILYYRLSTFLFTNIIMGTWFTNEWTYYWQTVKVQRTRGYMYQNCSFSCIYFILILRMVKSIYIPLHLHCVIKTLTSWPSSSGHFTHKQSQNESQNDQEATTKGYSPLKTTSLFADNILLLQWFGQQLVLW